MKKRNHILITLSIFTSLFTACTFELLQEVDQAVEDQTTIPGSVVNGISDETLSAIPVDEGEIGVSIDTRALAIIGYKPHKIAVSIEGALSTFSQTEVIVDEYTHVGAFKIKREVLSEDQIKGFRNGVPLTITVFDVAGKALENKTISRYIINSTARTIKIDTELPRVLKSLSFNSVVPHFFQVASDTEFKTLGFPTDYEGFNQSELSIIDQVHRLFFIESDTYEQDSAYHIKSDIYTYNTSGFVFIEADIYNERNGNTGDNGENIAINWYEDDPQNGFEHTGENRFNLEPTNNGTLKIRLFGSDKYLSSDNGTKIFFDDKTTNDLEFNIFAANVRWEFDDLGTKYSPAIIPPAQMDFAFQQTIINCSGATGDYEVGIATAEKTSTSMSFEESINIFSSATESESATVEASAGGSFFGVGVSVSASGTLSTETTTEFGQEKKLNQGIEIEESQQVSSSRLVTVLPYSAVEVFDVIQKLENVQIPFVQRFIIRGANGEGNYLTGPQIEAQLLANHFKGVIIEVGSDFIVISIRGAVNVNNYFEYNNSLHDIAGACD